nr:hypothetical protein [Tanacetum cinerariifolium]
MYWEFGKFTSQDGESLESYYSRFCKMMNELIRNQCKVTNHQEIDKLIALISLSFKKIYKPTNNNLQTSSNTSRANQDNAPRINKNVGYKNQRIGNVARARENVDAADSGPIFDDEPLQKLVEIVLFIVDFGCSKHMMGNLKLLINFVEKFMGTVKFGNDRIAPILGYGDLVQGAVTIKMVYYVKGLNHNLFSVGSHGTDLYSITLQDSTCPNPICLMAKASSSQAWLWHHRLSHLNFDTINLLSKNDIVVGLPKLKFIKDHLCSSCELGKAKRKSFHTKLTPSSKRRLQLLHMDLCGPMCKDETPKVLINFLWLVQRGLQAQVRVSRAYRVFNKRTRLIMESIHVNFNELPHMALDQISSDPAPECQSMALNHDSLSLANQ